ncbi:hypothetical protein QIS74_06610 [Colletotrichum tabaci]|uniref:Uncharacterized protein n=1 Tax=Colletotrichum tabaci TaxID=1209068 RepID=A0AAV9TDV6_9PEZI
MELTRPPYGAAVAGTYWRVTQTNHHKESLWVETTAHHPSLPARHGREPTTPRPRQQTAPLIILRRRSPRRRRGPRAKPNGSPSPANPLPLNGGIASIGDGGKVVPKPKGQGPEDRHHRPEVADGRRRSTSSSVPEAPRSPQSAHPKLRSASPRRPSSNSPVQTTSPLSIDASNGRRDRSMAASNASPSTFATAKNFDGRRRRLEKKVDDDRGTSEIDGNVIHSSSSESKRATRGVRDRLREVYGIVAGADMPVAIPSAMGVVTKKPGIPSTPTGMRTDPSMPSLTSASRSRRRRPTGFGCTDGKDHAAGAVTKSNADAALERLPSTHNPGIRMEGFGRPDSTRRS